MKVSELIEILKDCDQDHQVFIHDDEHGELFEIDIIDDALSDRVDININTEKPL